MGQPLTVLFMPESAYGPTNNCIGIGAVLRARGHRVVFAAEASWRGKLEPLGFEEDLVELAPSVPDGDAGSFWAEFVAQNAEAFRRPTIEQLECFVRPTWHALVEGARYCEEQLRSVVERQRPDVVVEDNVCAFPALMTAGVPFVRIVSCNPLEIASPALPPKFSGYPVADDSSWGAFRAEYARVHRDLWLEFDEWVRACGAPGLPELEFVHESEVANLYVYPEVIDYVDRRPLGPRWHRLDSSVRTTEGSLDPALEEFLTAGHRRGADGPSAVYLSLGSLGSADVELMERLVAALADTPHRYIVSKGPLADRFELPDNMWGAAQVPQTKVLPLVDAVISHGGNNTTTECFHFGKPMLVLPLFWDQHDNAQRVQETGFGRRLSAYGHSAGELVQALDSLLSDMALRVRMEAVGDVVRARRGTERAAAVIEGAARRRGR
jgi:UDP:flavonoid glycosyltransferase YjiC (YdhE family)